MIFNAWDEVFASFDSTDVIESLSYFQADGSALINMTVQSGNGTGIKNTTHPDSKKQSKEDTDGSSAHASHVLTVINELKVCQLQTLVELTCQSLISIVQLSARESLVGVFDFHLTAPVDVTSLFNSGIDFSLQPLTVFRNHKRLVVFDMDSTLIQQECIDELAREYGVFDRIAPITEQAMNGLIDFDESLKRRVGLLAGAPVDIIEIVRKRL
jgi:hypothetical protein